MRTENREAEAYNNIDDFKTALKRHVDKGKISKALFLQLCLQGMSLARLHPDDRSEIAYTLVDIGFHHLASDADTDIIQQILDKCADLELPDAHIDTHELTVDQQWEKLNELVIRASREMAEA